MNENKKHLDEETIELIRKMSPDQLTALADIATEYKKVAHGNAERLAEEIKESGLDTETVVRMRRAMDWRKIEAEEAEDNARAEKALRDHHARQRDLLTAFGGGGLVVAGGIIGVNLIYKAFRNAFK